MVHIVLIYCKRSFFIAKDIKNHKKKQCHPGMPFRINYHDKYTWIAVTVARWTTFLQPAKGYFTNGFLMFCYVVKGYWIIVINLMLFDAFRVQNAKMAPKAWTTAKSMDWENSISMLKQYLNLSSLRKPRRRMSFTRSKCSNVSKLRVRKWNKENF